jgi:hypothetical protein
MVAAHTQFVILLLGALTTQLLRALVAHHHLLLQLLQLHIAHLLGIAFHHLVFQETALEHHLLLLHLLRLRLLHLLRLRLLHLLQLHLHHLLRLAVKLQLVVTIQANNVASG